MIAIAAWLLALIAIAALVTYLLVTEERPAPPAPPTFAESIAVLRGSFVQMQIVIVDNFTPAIKKTAQAFADFARAYQAAVDRAQDPKDNT